MHVAGVLGEGSACMFTSLSAPLTDIMDLCEQHTPSGCVIEHMFETEECSCVPTASNRTPTKQPTINQVNFLPIKPTVIDRLKGGLVVEYLNIYTTPAVVLMRSARLHRPVSRDHHGPACCERTHPT